MTRLAVALPFALAALAAPAPAGDMPYPKVEHLYSGSMTVVGEPLSFPAENAGVMSLIVSLAPGEATGWHRHGTPLFAYILEGAVEVTYAGHGTRTYHAGEALLEAMDVPHRAVNTGAGPVRILAVYLTGDGRAPTIPADAPSE